MQPKSDKVIVETQDAFKGMPLIAVLAIALGGDLAAWESINRWIYQRLEWIAIAKLHDESLANDAIQETIKALIKEIPNGNAKFFDGEYLKAWLIRVLINKCNDILRKIRSRNEVSIDQNGEKRIDVPGCDTKPLDALIEQEEVEQQQALLRLLPKCLRELTEDEREIIRLWFFEESTLKEIAEELNLRDKNGNATANIANSRLQTVLKKLLTCIHGLVPPKGPKTP